MLKRITILLAAALVLATPAAAQQLFDFLGQSVVPASVGSTLSMDAVVTEGGGLEGSTQGVGPIEGNHQPRHGIHHPHTHVQRMAQRSLQHLWPTRGGGWTPMHQP